ncbi:3-hydroxyacyl-ACP dehydratase FabZ [Bdellovibrionota bacterium FG-2]
MSSSFSLGVDQIRAFLPHRAPFLFVDRVLEIHPQGDLDDLSSHNKAGIRVIAIKSITYNEPCFQGHFPDFSIFPGVLILEAMAQTASFSIYPYMAKDLSKLAKDFTCVLVGVNDARFRQPVVPGDQLRIETLVTKCRGKLWVLDCKAFVEDTIVAEAEVMANLIPNTEMFKSPD